MEVEVCDPQSNAIQEAMAELQKEGIKVWILTILLGYWQMSDQLCGWFWLIIGWPATVFNIYIDRSGWSVPAWPITLQYLTFDSPSIPNNWNVLGPTDTVLITLHYKSALLLIDHLVLLFCTCHGKSPRVVLGLPATLNWERQGHQGRSEGAIRGGGGGGRKLPFSEKLQAYSEHSDQGRR